MSALDGVERDASEDAVPPRASIRHNIFYLMSSQVVTWTLATATAMIIPRFLGPAMLGQVRLAGSLWLIAGTVTTLGTSTFLQLEISRNQRDGLRLVGPVLVLRTIAFGAATVLLSTYVSATTDDVQFMAMVALVGAGWILTLWSDVFSTVFLGLEHMSTTAYAGAATKLANFVAVLAVMLVGGDVFGMLITGLIVGVAGLGYLAWRFHRIARLTFESWRPTAISVLRRSFTFMAAGVALVMYQQIDIIVISWVAEEKDLGWYGAADVLFGSLLFPATVIMGAMFPTMGRLFVENRDDLNDLVARTFSLLSVVAVPIGLGTTLVASQVATVLYGEEFEETGIVLAILGPVTILTFGTILFGGTALATERGRLWIAVIVAAALLTIPLDLFLVPWAHDRYGNGAIGGALAYVATEGLQFVLGLWLVVPFLVNRTMAWRSLRIVSAGALMFAVGWPLRQYALPIPIAICATVYVFLILAFGVLAEEERNMIKAVFARARRSRGDT
jgi:O-antigen/teichoic acid export membrane protein